MDVPAPDDGSLLLLRSALDALPEAVAVFDRDDRFVFWNSKFAEIYGEGGDLRLGVRFEDHLRASVANGRVPMAVGREEEWIRDRLARFAAAAGAHEHRLADGRWVRVQDRDLAGGGKIGIRSDVTEAMRREQSFRLLFDANPAPMIVSHAETYRILAVNDAAVAFYGHRREDFLRLTVRDIRPEREAGELDAVARSVGDAPFIGGLRSHRTACGEERIVRFVGQKVNYAGQPALLAAFFDLTEQHRMEQEIRRTHAFLDEIVDHVPTAVFAKDMRRDGRFTIFNRASEALFGRSRDAVIGRTDEEAFGAEAAEVAGPQDRAALQRGGREATHDEALRRPDGELRFIRTRKIAVAGGSGGALRFVVGASEDVTEQRLVADRAIHMAHHDALTDLPNRTLFAERLSSSLVKLRAGRDALAVLFLDLDGFKAVNDTFGHAVGDGLLRAVAERLRGALRASDTVARFGGDEFAVLQAPLDGDHDAVRLAERIAAVISAPYLVDGRRPRVSCSIGIAFAPSDAAEPDALLERADAALYLAKREGKNTHRSASSVGACDARPVGAERRAIRAPTAVA